LKEKENKIEKLEEKNNSLTKQVEKYKNIIDYYKELNKKLQENIEE
jgi:exonuclease VII small subunit